MTTDCCSCQLISIAAIMTIILAIFNLKVRYYVKMFIYLFGSLILSVGPVPLMLRKPRHWSNALIPAAICRFLGKLLGVTFEVQGMENIRKEAGGVVLMNHQSALDLIILAHLWPIIGRATVIAKKSLFYILPYGIATWLWGTIFIDRADKGAVAVLNKEAKAITEKQAKLLFFPEGTRGDGAKLLPFKKGPFHLAVQSQAPIQPVVCNRYHFLDSKNKVFGRGHNIIRILPEIPTVGLSKDDISDLVERTYEIMQSEYVKLSDYAYKNLKGDKLVK